MHASGRSKPLITANQVTIARLALLPIGSWLLYQGIRGQTIALVFMTLVGCTDFVDGYLARKHGATVLGSLMDPIADKVFFAAVFLPMIELKWLPMSIVLLIFLREFIVTAARTIYSRRSVTLKTSYLAKIKTWYQMLSSGLIFLLRVSPPAVKWVAAAMLLGPGLIGLVINYRKTHRLWKGGIAFALSFAIFFGITFIASVDQLTLGLGWATVVITWASGGAYLLGLRELVGHPLDGQDMARLLGAVALPTLVCLLLITGRAPTWALITTVALEFAIGGLDNLLAHLDLLPIGHGWIFRAGGQAIFLGIALGLARHGRADTLIELLTLATLGLTAISTGILFYRHRDVYLGHRATAPIPARRPTN